MGSRWWVVAAAAVACAQAQDERLGKVLLRLAEETTAFRTIAPNALAEETLKQRARKGPSRFKPRVGDAATHPPEPKWQTREIVSEYSFSTFRESPNSLHEFRQVITVDGRQVTTRERARETLAQGMKSGDDRLKKRMLEGFEKHGLVGAATDFGQVILLFEKRKQAGYQFQFAGKGQIGADAALGYTFRQADGEGMTIFEGRQVIRRPLEGEIWVREEDYLPLRIRLSTVRERGDQMVRDEATVEYTMNQHGFLAPVSVVYRQLLAGQMVVENVFQYGPFRKFGAETEIKFTEAPVEGEKKP